MPQGCAQKSHMLGHARLSEQRVCARLLRFSKFARFCEGSRLIRSDEFSHMGLSTA